MRFRSHRTLNLGPEFDKFMFLFFINGSAEFFVVLGLLECYTRDPTGLCVWALSCAENFISLQNHFKSIIIPISLLYSI